MRPGSSSRALGVLLVAALGGCRATGARPPAAPLPSPVATSTPAPARAVPDAVHWVRTSAEYRALAVQAFRLATGELERRAAERPAGTWAVILDADETVIDNSQYQKERGGLPFTAESWREWVARRAAPPVPGSQAFLARVRELGGRIAIVTNRNHDECPDTEENFRTLAIPYDVMLCRPAGGPSDKDPRFESVAQGTASASLPPLEVVMWVGDNIQDFPRLRQDLRDQPEAALADFGSRYFVIPNPMYGSWERNAPR